MPDIIPKGPVSDPKRELAELARIPSQRPAGAATVASVARAERAIEYGEITIKMQARKPIWLDSVKRQTAAVGSTVQGHLSSAAYLDAFFWLFARAEQPRDLTKRERMVS